MNGAEHSHERVTVKSRVRTPKRKTPRSKRPFTRAEHFAATRRAYKMKLQGFKLPPCCSGNPPWHFWDQSEEILVSTSIASRINLWSFVFHHQRSKNHALKVKFPPLGHDFPPMRVKIFSGATISPQKIQSRGKNTLITVARTFCPEPLQHITMRKRVGLQSPTLRSKACLTSFTSVCGVIPNAIANLKTTSSDGVRVPFSSLEM